MVLLQGNFYQQMRATDFSVSFSFTRQAQYMQRAVVSNPEKIDQ